MREASASVAAALSGPAAAVAGVAGRNSVSTKYEVAPETSEDNLAELSALANVLAGDHQPILKYGYRSRVTRPPLPTPSHASLPAPRT